jgi:hypothetical protein
METPISGAGQSGRAVDPVAGHGNELPAALQSGNDEFSARDRRGQTRARCSETPPRNT